MSAPRWTYTEANASRWRHVFDDLIGGTTALEVPLEGNSKSLCSLRIRLTPSNGLPTSYKKRGRTEMEPYARLKHQLSHFTLCAGLRLHIKRLQPAAPSRTLTPCFARD